MQSMAYRFFIPLIILNGLIFTLIFKFRFAGVYNDFIAGRYCNFASYG